MQTVPSGCSKIVAKVFIFSGFKIVVIFIMQMKIIQQNEKLCISKSLFFFNKLLHLTPGLSWQKLKHKMTLTVDSSVPA